MTIDLATYELSDTDPIAEQPLNINITLKRHQLSLLKMCQQYETGTIPLGDEGYIRTHIGVIGDKVGSGKSYVILSLIKTPLDFGDEPDMKMYGSNKIVICKKDSKKHIKTNLLVIPHNLCNQWIQYIKSFSNDMNSFVVSRTKHLEQLRQVQVSDYDLLVVTCSYYNRLVWQLNQAEVKLTRVIFDEVDSINIPTCLGVESKFYWFVTASYGNLLYPRGYSSYDHEIRRYTQSATGLRNSGFIKDLFVDLHQYESKPYTRMLVVRNNSDYIQSSLQLPDIAYHYILCRTPIVISILNGIVDKNIIECLNADDLESAIQFVSPTQKGSEDNIITILIERYNKILKNIELRVDYTNLLEYDTEEEKVFEVEKLLKKHKETTTKIQCIQERVKNNDTCPICYDDYTVKTIVKCCSNAYCFKCINIWLGSKKHCPMCKRELKTDDVFVVTGADAIASMDVNPINHHSNEIHKTNDKETNLENIIDKRLLDDPNVKFLIFSNYENTISQTCKILARKNIKHAALKGNNYVIKNIVDRYKTGDLRVLLVNARHYGSGLNLENTTDVIMYHKLDSEIEKQVVGRAQRFGRSQGLNVWYLLHDTELPAQSIIE